MASLAVEHRWSRGVEVGLGRGILFRRLLEIGVEMVGVDLGLRPNRRAMQEAIAKDHPCRIYWEQSTDAAAHVEDGWADFVFIDAGHSYRAVKADIEAWAPKVKRGGWFGGHDYHPAHPGVIRAVDEAFGERADVLPFWIWVARDA